MSKETIKNSTEPKKVLHLDTISEPYQKTFLSFVQHLKRFRRKKEHTLEFRRENTEPERFVSSLFRCCTKLKKVFLIRFRDCIEVKNLCRFGRIFLLFLSTFELIWKLLTSTEPFLVGSVKTLFF